MKLDNKNKLLLGGFLALMVSSHQLAFKKTLEFRKVYLSAKDNAGRARDIPMELAKLDKRERYLDGQFKSINLDGSSMQSDLLKFLNGHTGAHGVKIMAFGAPNTVQEGNTIHITYIFTLEGNFKGILHVAHALENHGGFGVISHLAIEKEKDYRSKKAFLSATIYLKQVQ